MNIGNWLFYTVGVVCAIYIGFLKIPFEGLKPLRQLTQSVSRARIGKYRRIVNGA